MSTFGEDLIQSLNEALAHAKGERPTIVVERCPDTGLYAGYVPGFPGAHSQGETLEELDGNLREVIAMLLAEGTPALVREHVGTRTVGPA